MQKDVENQFCIIDENDNSILVNREIELIKLDNTFIIKNSRKINKFSKSKSYPDANLLINYNMNNFYDMNFSIIHDKNLNEQEKKNITNQNYDSDENSNINSSLIKKIKQFIFIIS